MAKTPIRTKASANLKKIVGEDVEKYQSGKGLSKTKEGKRVSNQGSRYQRMYEDETIERLASRPRKGK